MAWTCPCCGALAHGRPDPVALVESINLSPMQRRIADVLARRFGRHVAPDDLVGAVYAHDPSGGPDDARNTVAVQTSHLRRRIASHGLTIDKAYRGYAYRMTWSAE